MTMLNLKEVAVEISGGIRCGNGLCIQRRVGLFVELARW